MDIKVVDEKGQEVKSDSEVAEINPSDTIPVKVGELLLQSVGQVFDMTPTEIQKNADKINLLIDYAKTQTDDHTMQGIKWAIRSLQGKVGTPPLGQKWLPYLAEYAYLKMESIKRQEEIEKYERNV